MELQQNVSEPIIEKRHHIRKSISGRNHATYQDQVQKPINSIWLNCQGGFWNWRI